MSGALVPVVRSLGGTFLEALRAGGTEGLVHHRANPWNDVYLAVVETGHNYNHGMPGLTVSLLFRNRGALVEAAREGTAFVIGVLLAHPELMEQFGGFESYAELGGEPDICARMGGMGWFGGGKMPGRLAALQGAMSAHGQIPPVLFRLMDHRGLDYHPGSFCAETGNHPWLVSRTECPETYAAIQHAGRRGFEYYTPGGVSSGPFTTQERAALGREMKEGDITVWRLYYWIRDNFTGTPDIQWAPSAAGVEEQLRGLADQHARPGGYARTLHMSFNELVARLREGSPPKEIL